MTRLVKKTSIVLVFRALKVVFVDRTYDVYQVDAFTTVKFRGNPAGVVPYADSLNDCEMQQIALELNNSETAFVFKAAASDHDIKIRYFTPKVEVPICGHATLATHFVRASFDPKRIVRFKTQVGILTAEIHREANPLQIFFNQGKPEFGAKLEGGTGTALMTALGLKPADFLDGAVPQIVSTGHSKVLIPIKDVGTLNGLEPNLDALSALSRLIGCNGFYVFCFSKDGAPNLTHGRMFAPAIGISEDPVTGNASGPLGAYLWRYQLVKSTDPVFRFIARQGEAMGRPGEVTVEVRKNQDEITEVKIGGSAITVFKTTITL